MSFLSLLQSRKIYLSSWKHIFFFFFAKGLKGRLAEHQHKLYQVLDEGKHLLLSVCCPSLENQLALLGEHWLNNAAKVNKELQRLEAILKHWTRSERLQK